MESRQQKIFALGDDSCHSMCATPFAAKSFHVEGMFLLVGGLSWQYGKGIVESVKR